jgi:uncharacterized protein
MVQKLTIKVLFTVILTAISTFHVLAQSFPEKPTTLVNDYTNTLSPEQRNHLEQKLVAFDDSTSTQIAVVLIKSVGVYDVADYTVRLAQNWGVGRTKKNNGVVLLAALDDRKVTIQTGYGVEGALPDAIAKRIIEREIKPNFKQGDYFQGLEQGTNAIIAYTKGEYKNTEPKTAQRRGGPSIGLIIVIIIIIALIARKGGGGGGGRRVIGSRGGADLLWWTMMSGMGRGGGGGGGGGWGGFSGGSGGGGGGFGGFGGGSFGGGGASGDW